MFEFTSDWPLVSQIAFGIILGVASLCLLPFIVIFVFIVLQKLMLGFIYLLSGWFLNTLKMLEHLGYEYNSKNAWVVLLIMFVTGVFVVEIFGRFVLHLW